MQEVTSMVMTYRQERDIWEKAYYELNEKSTQFAQSQQKRLTDLESQINVERKDWQNKIRQAKKPGIGVFGGYGTGGWTVGVGLVWRVF